MTQSEPKVGIAVIEYGGFRTGALANWLVANAHRIAHLWSVNRRDVRCGRNVACWNLLRSDGDVLFMVNHDIEPPLEFQGPWDMTGADVVTAKVIAPDGRTHHKDTHGTGAVAIRRHVLETLGGPWFRPPVYDASGQNWTACECMEFEADVKSHGFKMAWWKMPLLHRHTSVAKRTAPGS